MRQVCVLVALIAAGCGASPPPAETVRTVRIEGALNDRDVRDVTSAVEEFNRFAGRRFFRVVNSETADVTVQLVQGGGLEHYTLDNEIWVYGQHALPVLATRIMHNLGHILGLNNNDYPGTLMYGEFSERFSEVVPRMCDATRSYLDSL